MYPLRFRAFYKEKTENITTLCNLGHFQITFYLCYENSLEKRYMRSRNRYKCRHSWNLSISASTVYTENHLKIPRKIVAIIQKYLCWKPPMVSFEARLKQFVYRSTFSGNIFLWKSKSLMILSRLTAFGKFYYVYWINQL